MFKIDSLSVSCADHSILHHIDLVIEPGSVHALMGPNGSGKSTLAATLMGHPAYSVTAGSVHFAGQSLLELPVHKRAQAGLFLSFQQPYEIPGVSIATFVKAAYEASHGAIDPKSLQEKAFFYMDLLAMDQGMWFRSLHEGFSGGQKKKLELLQLLILRPKLAILDEIDSGLDVDALQAVAKALAYARKESPDMGLLLITHYQRILRYIQPDHVHIMHKGRLVDSGNAELAQHIERDGYRSYEAN